MIKRYLTILLVFITINCSSQALFTVGMTKAQTADAINGNINMLIGYIDPTLISVIDTLSDTFTNTDLVGLNDAFDILASYNSVVITDRISYGMKGVNLRLAINTNFQKLYDVYEDEPAFNFLSITGVSDNKSVAAISYLYKAYQDSGLLNYYSTIYPFIGSTASSHKYNLLSPYDQDTSFRLTFYGTVTHNANGIQGNGSSGYADTHLNLNTIYSDLHYSISSSTDQNRWEALMAVWWLDVGIFNVGTEYDDFYFNAQLVPVKGKKRNYYINTKGLNSEYFVDGLKYKRTYTETTLVEKNFLISAQPTTPVSNFSSSRVNFATIGTSMPDSMVWKATAIERKFNRILERADTSGAVYPRLTSDYPIPITPLPIALGDSARPSHFENARLTEYRSWNVGALISFNALTYYHDWWNAYPHNINVMSHLTANLTNINVGQWIAPLDSAGVKYIALTLTQSSGYSLYPNSHSLPKRLVDKFDGITEYDLSSNLFFDNNIVRKFVDTCNARGIEPVGYVQLGLNTNLMPFLLSGITWDSLDAVVYDNWLAKYLQDIITEYDFKYLWLDAGWNHLLTSDGKRELVNQQYIYDAIKAVDSTIIVIENNMADSTFSRYPFDVSSNEEIVIGMGTKTDEELANTTLNHNGVNYFIPCEFICNITSGGGNDWYGASDAGLSSVRPISEIQAVYDRAKAVGANFVLNVIPGRLGTVQESQFAIWRNLVW